METMAQSPADTGAVSHAGVPAVTLATPVCRFEDFLGATAADRLLDDACRAQLEHLAAERGQDAQIPSAIGLGVGFIVGPGSGVGSSIPPPGDPCRMKSRIGRNAWLLVTTVFGPVVRNDRVAAAARPLPALGLVVRPAGCARLLGALPTVRSRGATGRRLRLRLRSKSSGDTDRDRRRRHQHRQPSSHGAVHYDHLFH